MNREQKILERKIKIQEKKLIKEGKKRETESIKKIVALAAFLQLKKDRETLLFMDLELKKIKNRPLRDRLIDLEHFITIVENIIKQKYQKKKKK